MTKIMETLNCIGLGGAAYYVSLPRGWRIALWPVYVVLALLWFTALAVILPIYMVYLKIKWGLSFVEQADTIKEGMKLGLDELNE